MEGWVWRRWWGTSSSIDSHVPPVYSCSEDDAEQRARGGSTPRRPRPAQTQTGALRDGRLLADTVSAPSFPVSTQSQQQPGLFSHAGCWNVGFQGGTLKPRPLSVEVRLQERLSAFLKLLLLGFYFS